MNNEIPLELLEAQRRIKASQTGDLGIRKPPSGSLEVALGKLRATLDKTPVVANAKPDKRSDEQKTASLRSSWNAPLRHTSRTEFDPLATEWIATKERLCRRLGSGLTVALVGVRGPGKTQIGVEMMKAATLVGRSAYYCTAMDYFMRIKDSFQNDAEKSQSSAQQFFIKPKLLVIDEMHVRSDSAWEDNMLTDLIGKRYNAMLDTVLISNQKLNEFEQSVGASVMDRLNETGGVIEARWKSFRT